MIDWQKRLELQAVLNKIRIYEKMRMNHSSLLLGYTGDFLIYVQFGMLVDGEYKKNLYAKTVFEISRQ
jgi:hypothetical protein